MSEATTLSPSSSSSPPPPAPRPLERGRFDRLVAFFGVPESDLRNAIAAVGDDASAIDGWLRSRTRRQSPTTRRALRTAQRKDRLIEEAARMATRLGIKGLSFGDLAVAVGTSKSNLLLHFTNKSGLTLAIIDSAERSFFERVVLPTVALPSGLSRLTALADAWIEHTAISDGGCLLAALVHELDGCPGIERDRLAAVLARLRQVVDTAVEEGHRRNELAAGVSGATALFDLQGIILSLNIGVQMGEVERSLSSARAARRWWVQGLTRTA
jgi:AcrR family transcriptional regulator